MDRIGKFLKQLNKNNKAVFLKILTAIEKLDLKNYDTKPLKGMKNVYRLRKGKIRIIFTKQKNKGIILDIAYRKDIYKK